MDRRPAAWVRGHSMRNQTARVALDGDKRALPASPSGRYPHFPLLAPFSLLAFLFSTGGRQRISYLTSLTVRLGIALIPTALLFFAAPSQFHFGNFTYNSTLNPLYHQSLVPGEYALLRKFAYPVQQLLKSPCDFALVAGFIYFGLRPWWRAGWRNIAGHDGQSHWINSAFPFWVFGRRLHRQYYPCAVPSS